MPDDLSATLLRLSEEIEAAAQPAPAAEVRRRGGQRRSRTTVGAAALSVTAAAVTVPLVLGAWQPGGGTGPTGPSMSTGSATSSGLPSSEPSPSPEPSLGWDTSVQRMNVELDHTMAECMVAGGFMAIDMTAKPIRSDDEEAAEFGFSISTRLEGEVVRPGPIDPVAAARADLPASKHDEFDAVLNRCWERAAQAERPVRLPPDRAIVVPSDDGSGAFTVLIVTTRLAVADYEEDVQARVQADPRVVAATAGWAECMRSAGYDVESPEQLRAAIEQQTRPYRVAYEAGLPQAERGNDGPNSKSLEEVLSPGQLAGLAEVQRYERAAAVASAGCDDELNVLLPVVWQDKLDEYFGYTG